MDKIDLTPLIVQAIPYLVSVILAFVAYVLHYLQVKLNVKATIMDQLRKVINEGINHEANAVLTQQNTTGTHVELTNSLVASVVTYVVNNAGVILKAANITPDSLSQMVTALMVSHEAVVTPLTAAAPVPAVTVS
jgi:hypothetical protein